MPVGIVYALLLYFLLLCVSRPGIACHLVNKLSLLDVVVIVAATARHDDVNRWRREADALGARQTFRRCRLRRGALALALALVLPCGKELIDTVDVEWVSVAGAGGSVLHFASIAFWLVEASSLPAVGEGEDEEESPL